VVIKVDSSSELRGVFVSNFSSFFISFCEIQKLDGFKSERLDAPFHKLLSFSLFCSSSFLIFLKLIHKSDKSLNKHPLSPALVAADSSRFNSGFLVIQVSVHSVCFVPPVSAPSSSSAPSAPCRPRRCHW
jgi:hypothetical protein